MMRFESPGTRFIMIELTRRECCCLSCRLTMPSDRESNLTARSNYRVRGELRNATVYANPEQLSLVCPQEACAERISHAEAQRRKVAEAQRRKVAKAQRRKDAK